MNPISYSDFISKDNSIDDLISSLETAKKTYESMAKLVTTEASNIKSALGLVSVATQEGQAETDGLAEGTKRLARLQKELTIATSQVGYEIQKYKVVLADVNKAQSDNAKIHISAEGSVKELKAELSKLVREYESLSGETRLTEENTLKLELQIKALKEEIKKSADNIKISTTALSENERTTRELIKTKQRLLNIYSDETKELLGVKRELNELLKIRRLEEVANSTVNNSYNNLAARYELAKIELNKYSQEVINSSKFLTNMQQNSKLMREEMIRLQEATGAHTLKVGDYGRAWNGLGVSVQQVFRELPVLAVSWNTFFLAISNNLPILADEIDRVVQANKRAKAEGREFDSLTKQLGASIFSMQTILVLLVTALTLYGGKMITFIKDMIAGANTARSFEAALDGVRKAMIKDGTEIGKNIALFKKLQEDWREAEGNLTRQENLVNDNASAFSSWGLAITDVNDANRLFIEQGELVIETMQLQAEAAAASKLAEKAYEEVAKGRIKLAGEKAKGPAGFKPTMAIGGSGTVGGWTGPIDVDSEYNAVIKNIEKTIERKEEEAKAYFNVARAADLSRMAKLKEAGFTLWEDRDKSKDKSKDKSASKGPTDLSIEQANLRIRKEYLDSLSALERDEFKRRRQQLLNQYTIERDDLLNKQKNEERLTEESRELINDVILNKAKKLNQDLKILDIEMEQNSLDYAKNSLELELSVTERGSEQYLRLRTQLMRNQMEYEVLENKKLIEAKQQDEIAIRTKFAYTLMQLEKSMDDLFFKQVQDYQEAEFNSIRQSEYNKTKFILEQERERWKRRIEMAEAGLIQISSLELATAKKIIEGLDRQLKDLEKNKDIFDLLGINLDSKQKQALTESVSFIKSQIAEILQAELDLAEARLNKANEQVDRTYEVLRLEIEARSKGYANLVETSYQELSLAKEQQRQALIQKSKALKAQQNLDSIEQVSSLVTASANIWKSFSSLGPIGVAGAIAAIALMFGSFVTAKVRASKVTRELTEEYGEGHVELLEGGSHRSGNDIPLGRTKEGKERRAEGGEVFAVINKRSTDKYGARKVFDIMHSLNKGIFEDKYANVFNKTALVSNPILDMGDISDNVRAIKNNTDYQYYKNAEGKIVERYKNRTRTFKS